MAGKSRITEREIDKLIDALERALPMSYACKYIGIPKSSIYDRMRDDKAFRTRIDMARAEAVIRLVEETRKQSGAWKLLKNLAKDEFKEHVEIATVDPYETNETLENKSTDELDAEYERIH